MIRKLPASTLLWISVLSNWSEKFGVSKVAMVDFKVLFTVGFKNAPLNLLPAL